MNPLRRKAASERAEPRTFTAEALNNVVQTLAIVGAGIWGVYTFVYQAKIAPSLAPPTLSVTSTLEKAGQKGSLIAIRSTVTRSNVGQAGVRLLSLTYNVAGIRVHFADGDKTSPTFNRDYSQSSTASAARYYEQPEQSEVILRHGVLFEGATRSPSRPSTLNPGETISRDMIFYADRARFDSIRFQVRLLYTKQSHPPVPLMFETDPDGELSAVPNPSCNTAPERCAGLTGTDFATELSLW